MREHDLAQLEERRGVYHDILSRYARLPRVSMETVAMLAAPYPGMASVPLPVVRVGARRGGRFRVGITAGIHGDEIAGVLGAIAFAERGIAELPECEFVIVPCANPIGFIRNHREGSEGFDLNRSVTSLSTAPEITALRGALSCYPRLFDAFFDLHEDNFDVECEFAPTEPKEVAFYLYEAHSASEDPIGSAIVDAVMAGGFAVSGATTIYGEAAHRGVVQSAPTSFRSSLDHLERFMVPRHARRAITIETPNRWPIHSRIEAQVTAMTAGIESAMRFKRQPQPVYIAAPPRSISGRTSQ